MGGIFATFPNDRNAFAPFSFIDVNITVINSLNGTVYREIDFMDRLKLITLNEFKGSFIDSFQLPNRLGYHYINYILANSTDDTKIYNRTFKIIINDPPRIKSLIEPKPYFNVGENVNIPIEVHDDSSVNLSCFIDNVLIDRKEVVCNNKIKRENINFKIPPNDKDSVHNISIIGLDNYSLVSNKIEFQYKIWGKISPDLEIDHKFNAFYKENDLIKVTGRVRNMNISNDVLLVSSINNTNVISYGRQKIKDTSWKDVTFYVRVISNRDSVNTLRLYCIDNYQGISNTFIHTFSVIPENFGYVVHSCVCFRKKSFLNGMIAFLLQ